jgi:hypothetical protein
MKILLLDGAKKTSISMVPMYLSQRYTTKVVGVISPDLDVLCQKYDSWSNIPEKEIIATMDQTMSHVTHVIETCKPDVIIGLDYGSCVLSNLVTDFYWNGSAIYLNPDGYFFSPKKEDFTMCDPPEAKSYWVLRKKDTAAVRKSIEKISHFREGTTILVPDKVGVDSIMSTNLLEAIIESCVPTQ